MRSGLRTLTSPARPRPSRSIRASRGGADGRVGVLRRGAGRGTARAATPRGRGRGRPLRGRRAGRPRRRGSRGCRSGRGGPSGCTVRWPTSRARPELPVCRRPSSTSAPPTPRWPEATTSRCCAPRPGAVPVLGERGHVDVVADEGRDGRAVRAADADPRDLRARRPRATGAPAGQARCSGLRAVPSGSATADGTARPAPTQTRPEARSSSAPGLDDRAQHVRRVGGHGHAAGRGGDDLAAEADQRGPEAVGVHLRGERHRARPARRRAGARGGPARRPGRWAGCRPGSAPAPPAPRRPRPRWPGSRPSSAVSSGAGRRAAGVHQGERGPSAPRPRSSLVRICVTPLF